MPLLRAANQSHRHAGFHFAFTAQVVASFGLPLVRIGVQFFCTPRPRDAKGFSVMPSQYKALRCLFLAMPSKQILATALRCVGSQINPSPLRRTAVLCLSSAQQRSALLCPATADQIVSVFRYAAAFPLGTMGFVVRVRPCFASPLLFISTRFCG